MQWRGGVCLAAVLVGDKLSVSGSLGDRSYAINDAHSQPQSQSEGELVPQLRGSLPAVRSTWCCKASPTIDVVLRSLEQPTEAGWHFSGLEHSTPRLYYHPQAAGQTTTGHLAVSTTTHSDNGPSSSVLWSKSFANARIVAIPPPLPPVRAE